MKVGDIPETAYRTMLKINITVPQDYKNGEAGMGYATGDEYRESEQWDFTGGV